MHHPETNEEVEIILIAKFIEILRGKYPNAIEEDSDFILEYVFENRELG
jgi:hypothetical protein